MEEVKEILTGIKSKLISEIISELSEYLSENQIEDVDYTISLIDYCLLDLMNKEKINLLYMELDGLYRHTFLGEPGDTDLKIRLKSMMEELKCIIEKGYEISE